MPVMALVALFEEEVASSLQAAAEQQVLALVGGVARLLVDLTQQVVELVGQRLAQRDRGRVLAEAAVGRGDEALRLVEHLLDRGHAGVGGLDGADALADRVLELREVVRAAVQSLRGKERNRAIDGGVDLVAGSEPLLCAVDPFGGELQQQQVVADARSQLNVVRRHQGSPSCRANFGRALAPESFRTSGVEPFKATCVPDANPLRELDIIWVVAI